MALELLESPILDFGGMDMYFEVYKYDPANKEGYLPGDTIFKVSKDNPDEMVAGIFYGFDEEGTEDGFFFSAVNNRSQISQAFSFLNISHPRDQVVIRLLNSNPEFDKEAHIAKLKAKAANPTLVGES